MGRSKMLKFLTAALLSLAVAGGATPAAAQVDRIAAVVNDEIVSLQDLEQRVRLALMLSKLPDSIDTRRRVVPQVLRKMIDEMLQTQEAKRMGVTVTPVEVQKGLAAIERQAGLPPGGYPALMQRYGIDPQAMLSQIEADLTWYKLGQRRLGPTIKIGDEEIADRLQIIRDRQGQPEYRALEIFIAVENPDQDADARRLADRLLEQLRQGTPFSSLANQFSQSPTAANGGQMGWVSEDAVDPEIAAALRQMETGRVSTPVRTAAGWHILALAEKRIAGATADAENTKLDLAHIVLPIPKGGPSKAELMGRAQQLVSSVKNCDQLQNLGRSVGATKVGSMGVRRVGELDAATRQVLDNLPDNRASFPIETGDGLEIVMICSREIEMKVQLPSTEAVRRMIENERLEMLSRRYLRDLRRSAYVDVRM